MRTDYESNKGKVSEFQEKWQRQYGKHKMGQQIQPDTRERSGSKAKTTEISLTAFV